MKLKGTVHKFGNNTDTDAIIPARYLNTSDPVELAKHCMEDADADFPKKVKKGDIIVAGSNFGCGSSREHAPVAIKSAGVSCVIAADFARIFYRNAFNIGLLIFESAEASRKAKNGDVIEVEAETGRIRNITRKEEYKATPIPEFMRQLVKSGGLMKYGKKMMRKKT